MSLFNFWNQITDFNETWYARYVHLDCLNASLFEFMQLVTTLQAYELQATLEALILAFLIKDLEKHVG